MTRATVRAKRIALNLSQRNVARAVGISQAALSNYESGSLQLGAEKLEAVAELLGLDRVRRAKAHLRQVERLADKAEYHLSEIQRLAGVQA